MITAQHDGHGIGIITGAGIASRLLLRRRVLTTARSINQCTPAVIARDLNALPAFGAVGRRRGGMRA